VDTDKVYALYEKWSHGRRGYYDDLFLEFAALLLKALEEAKGRDVTVEDLKA
jgi:hypothetical protein